MERRTFFGSLVASVLGLLGIWKMPKAINWKWERHPEVVALQLEGKRICCNSTIRTTFKARFNADMDSVKEFKRALANDPQGRMLATYLSVTPGFIRISSKYFISFDGKELSGDIIDKKVIWDSSAA